MKVIVFALNGCPVSALGPYGNEWVGTPHLDRLAAEGVVFDRHISDCPEPAAARKAWSAAGRLPGALRAAGVRTVLVRHTRPANDPPAAFLAGWDEVVDARPADDDPAEPLLAALPRLLDRLPERWLLWVELDRLLPPWHVPQAVFEAYIETDPEDDEPEVQPVAPVEQLDDGPDVDAIVEPDVSDADESDAEDFDDDEDESEEEDESEQPPPWADPPTGWFDRDDLASWEYLHSSVAAAVTAFDADLGRVFDLLRGRGLDRSAAWVVTADRGVPLGEHGLIGPHRPWLHEELVHLPLVVRLPDAAEAGRRVSALTQPADLPPTLLAWLRAEGELPAGGVDLLPLVAGRVESVRPFAVSTLAIGEAEEWAIRTPHWALLLPVRAAADDDPRPPRLYEKPEDYWEVNDLRTRHLDTAEGLERALREAAVGHGTACRLGPAEDRTQ